MKEVFELGVYRLSEALADMIWYDFDTWSVKAKITIGHQVIRSSDSIAANIAEGYGRYTRQRTGRSFTGMHAVRSRKRSPGGARPFVARAFQLNARKITSRSSTN